MKTSDSSNDLIGQTYKTSYHWLQKDFLYFKREHQFHKMPHIETDVFGRFWMLWIIHPEKGELAISRDGLKFFNGNFALLLPPFSIVEWHIFSKNLNWEGYVWPQHKDFDNYPIPFQKAALYTQPFAEAPKNQYDIFDELLKLEPLLTIDKEQKKNVTAIEIKKYFDLHSNEEFKIADAANALNLKAYELGRIFKKEYGLNPIVYLQKLRIMNSIHSMLFLNPDKVSSVAFDNGFSDLSRFNKNFLKYTRSTPSQHMQKSYPR